MLAVQRQAVRTRNSREKCELRGGVVGMQVRWPDYIMMDGALRVPTYRLQLEQ